MTGDSTLPRFTTRAELIAWVEQKLAAARGDDAATFLVVLDHIRRVTLAHVDLKD